MASDNTVNEVINEMVFNNDTRICEMSDNQLINVPVDTRIDIGTITENDNDPKFVNVEVIRAGVSKVNKRRYNNNIVKEIGDMIAGTQGFFGHPDPSKYGFEFREPQCIYVGSIIEHMPDGIDRCIAKAYLFKSSPLREWVPKSIAAGNPMTVSINGMADVIRSGDILDVVHMNELQSIDWANPGTEGMETSQAMSVVREMKDEEGGSRKMADVVLNAQDIIKNATVTEFKAFNPNGYDAIVKGVTVTELRAINPRLVESIIEEAKVSEMQFTIDGKQETVKVSELQDKIDTYESKISQLEGDITSSKITEYKTRKMSEMVPDEFREKIGARVTGNTEAEIDASINAEISYVREMGGMTNVPVGVFTRDKDEPSDMKSQMRSLFHVKEDNK